MGGGGEEVVEGVGGKVGDGVVEKRGSLVSPSLSLLLRVVGGVGNGGEYSTISGWEGLEMDVNVPRFLGERWRRGWKWTGMFQERGPGRPLRGIVGPRAGPLLHSPWVADLQQPHLCGSQTPPHAERERERERERDRQTDR